MKNKRVIQFALVGLLIALALQGVGYRMDHSVPRIPLGNQTLYNWLTLVFSPVALFLRLGNPEAPIVASWTSFLIALFSNASLYAISYFVVRAFFLRIQIKLAHENIPLIAQRHPNRIIRLAAPHWKPRRA